MGKRKKVSKNVKEAKIDFYQENINFVNGIYKRLNITNKKKYIKKEKIKKEEIQEELNNENSSVCCICYLNIRKDKFIQLKCHHEICKKCYSKWKSIKNECPYCRNKIEHIEKKEYDKYSIANLTNEDCFNLYYMFSKGY